MAVGESFFLISPSQLRLRRSYVLICPSRSRLLCSISEGRSETTAARSNGAAGKRPVLTTFRRCSRDLV